MEFEVLLGGFLFDRLRLRLLVTCWPGRFMSPGFKARSGPRVDLDRAGFLRSSIQISPVSKAVDRAITGKIHRFHVVTIKATY